MHTSKIIVIALVVLLFTGLAISQQPNLLGAWKAEVTVLRSDDKLVRSLVEITLVFEEQDKGLIRGYKLWKDLKNVSGNVAGKEVLTAKEPLIGSIESDGDIRIVETDDYGLMFVEMVGPDSLEVSYIEPYPHAVAWTAVFRRTSQ